ncbi:MAG: S8 family serine peptidase [bacterium]
MKIKTFKAIIFIILISLIILPGLNTYGEDNDQVFEYEYINYIVRSGDTLYKIAMEHGSTVESIMTLNELDSTAIYPEQLLKIAIPEEDNQEIYRVVAGDSLYLISRKYDISIDSIKETNSLKSDMISIGQRLIIPVEKDDTKETEGDELEEKPDINYESLRGSVIINNKTQGREISRQDTELENNALPLNNNNEMPLYEESEIIVKYNPMINSQSVEDFEEEYNLISISSLQREDGHIVKYKAQEDSNLNELIERYNDKEDIAWAEPNYIYHPTAIPEDQYYDNYQWDMVNMNMEAAWDITKGDKSVIVAVIDTGIVPNHPDLKDNLLQGADFVGGVNRHPISSYNQTDNDPTDTTTRADGGSHGTHVAGTIGAVTNNKVGVAGVNWDLKILPIRALRKQGGSSWDIVEGIYYAIDQGVDVINMSFGGNGRSSYQQEAIKKAVESGITVVAATGNENSAVYYPAAFPETIAVGSVGKNNSRAAYSNYGPEVDLVAPGGNYSESIVSTWGYYENGNSIPAYTGMIGTSMAAPHVSGVAALLYAIGVSDPEEIKERLINTARDLGTPGKNNEYGHGIVDAYGALLNKKVLNPQVFTADKDGNSLYLKSEIVKANDNGSFKLDKVESDSEYFIAWFDANDNDLIDAGDYYGELAYSSNQQDIKMEISYLSKANDISYSLVK